MILATVAASLGTNFTMRPEDLQRRWLISPTADLVITLPDMDPLDNLQIVNMDGTRPITIKDSGGTTIVTLSLAGDQADFAVAASGAVTS